MTGFPLETVRGRFPALAMNDRGLRRVYLDNPAGTQVPRMVADAISDAILHRNANLGGMFASSRMAGEVWEGAHRAMADEVIVTPRTFIASISCVVNAGAIPVFADVDADSGNISPATIAKVITPRTRAVICVHLGGWPCDMDGIMALADQHGFKVIEDCAQAHGSRYKGRSVGSLGHVGAWSFCQDKIMTTGGEGGMLATPDRSLWERAWSLSQHGKDPNLAQMPATQPGFRWTVSRTGTNLRMTEMQAAIGLVQLGRLDGMIRRRREICDAYRAVLPGLGLSAQAHPAGAAVNEQTFGAVVGAGMDRDAVVAALQARGIGAGILSYALTRIGSLAPLGQSAPVAEDVVDRGLALPVYPAMTDADVADVIAALGAAAA